MTLALTLATVASARTYTVLKSFNASDGSMPLAGLVVADSTLDGTTVYGGSSYWTNWVGYGVVFKVNTDGSGYTVLKNFLWAMALVRGVAWSYRQHALWDRLEGGVQPWRVFKVNTDGSGYAVLKGFNGSDGADPYATWCCRPARSMERQQAATGRSSFPVERRGLPSEHGRVGLYGAQEFYWQRRHWPLRAWSWRETHSMGRRQWRQRVTRTMKAMVWFSG